jgi:uridine kinase
VQNSEEYYNAQVMRAAEQIAADRAFRFVLLCGPSASGKTTTAHKLKHRLISLGVGARVVSMDDFYLGRDYYDKLPDGSPDMESFSTVDHKLLNELFEELMLKGVSMFPLFDFAKQQRSLGQHEMRLGEGDVLIMEGIHALNPAILSNIPHENVFRIYVSVRSKFINGGENILIPKDIRLIRRIVRDNNFRNYTPLDTLRSWRHVVAGERVNIDLYRDDVNLKIDNTIDYEVCIWRYQLAGILRDAAPGQYDAHPEIQRIFVALSFFPEISRKLIPKNSLLREFVGDNI